MRALVQRVARARVVVDKRVAGQIGRGLVVLLGVGRDDGLRQVEWTAAKVAGLRVFTDAQGKMSLSAADVGGAFLVVSQFTLYGSVRRGLRPEFVGAAPPEEAERLYGAFVERLRGKGHTVETGVFRAHMEVELVNDGPVTLYIDSDEVKGHGI